MKVNSLNNINFTGIYNSKILKKGMEFAADNGALFAATTSLILSAVRPLSILATPNTDKNNKQSACAKSISSSLVGYFLMFAVSKPISNSIKKINDNPQKYLSENTLNNFKKSEKSLLKSKSYIFATQLFKLGAGMLIAVPKSLLTVLCLPFLINNLFDKKRSNQVSFTGKSDFLSRGFAKILNNKKYQEFANKFQDTNFPMNIVALTDILTTTSSVLTVKNSKKVPEQTKKPLIFNYVISTGLSLVSGYAIDKMTQKSTEKFIQKFKEVNKTSPKLDKYIEGIKIAKPVLIIGGIYYVIIPIIATFLSDKIGKTGKSQN